MKNRKAKWMAAVLTAALCVTALGGCGSKDETEAGKVVTICKQAGLTDMDPQLTGMTNNMEMVAATVEGLYKMTSEGKAVPAMAERVETSEDGLTWTFKIRSDAK